MHFSRLTALALTAALLALIGQGNAAIVHTSDFIADGNRTAFNGFEGIVDATPLYIEGGIRVEEINDAGWLFPTYFHPEGDQGWYRYGNGYTRITLTSGEDFENVGFFRSTGWGQGDHKLLYALFNDGVEIQREYLDNSFANNDDALIGKYLGFSGGGFDEIRLRDWLGTDTDFDFLDGNANALAIDAIETAVSTAGAVPEPTTLAIWGFGALGCAAVAYRRKRKQVA